MLDAIGQRLGQLSPDCAASLRAAALLGTRFAVPVVATMTGRDVGDCLTSLDEAARAALVLDGGAAGERRFAHDVVRDGIVAGLDTGQRITLHRRAAEAIEAHAPRADAVVFDLAHHWAGAAVAGDRAAAVLWTERAGREAMRLHAYEDGRRWYGQALEFGEGVLDDVARCRLLIAFAGAQCVSSDFTGGLATCGEAVDLAVRIGRPDLAGEAALVPEPTFDEGIDQVIRALCERALAVLDDSPAALRARVLARYGWVCDHLSDLDSADPAVQEALDVAEASGDATAMEAALTAHHMVRSGPDGLAEREANADRMWALGTRTGSAGRLPVGIGVALRRGERARRHGARGTRARGHRPLGHPGGRPDGAVAAAALPGDARPGPGALRRRIPARRPGVRHAGGHRVPAGVPAVGRSAGHPVPSHRADHGGTRDDRHHGRGRDRAGLALDRCHPDLGAGEHAGGCRAAAGGGLRLPPARAGLGVEESPHAVLGTWAFGIATAIAVGADDDVATLRAKLGAWRGHHVVNGRYAMAYGGPAELYLGRAAAHLGLVDDAVADLDQAVKACTQNGAEGYRAEAEYELASALVRRSAPGDLARARTLVVEALRRMDELGMPPIKARAEKLLDRIDSAAAVVLTRRELEVADLVAQGLTNREIASRLFLSERTAQNHVQHILDKLDLPNRSQVAVWVRARQMSRSAE